MRFVILAINLIFPVIMIVFGNILWKHTPKLNYFFGFRTTLSLKNQDTWDFANKDCGKRWWKFGWILLAVTVIIHCICIFFDITVIEQVTLFTDYLFIAFFVGSIFPTQSKLKRTFNNDGTRK